MDAGKLPNTQEGTRGSRFRDNVLSRRQALQQLFLRRLRRLVFLRYRRARPSGERSASVLNHAIYSTYCDCLELGLRQEAITLLRNAAAQWG